MNAAAPDSPFGPLIHTYTRADAIRDGELVDATDTAREAGIRIPVALTRAVWADCVAWTDADNDRKGTLQDEAGRLWDVVYMARTAMTSHASTDRCRFVVYRIPRAGRGVRPWVVWLVAHLGAGDSGEPVVTIMQPGES